jgi:DNA polymerase-1
MSVEEIKHHPVYRPLGKTVGLAILYGIGPAKLAQMLSSVGDKTYTYQEAHRCIETFYRNFPGLEDFRRRVQKYYTKNKRLVNMFGRPVYMEAAEVEHKAVNAVIQGSASDLNCIANLKNIPERLLSSGIDAKLLHLVHDECIWAVRPAHITEFQNIVTQGMVDAFTLRVPLVIEPKVGTSWGIK